MRASRPDPISSPVRWILPPQCMITPTPPRPRRTKHQDHTISAVASAWREGNQDGSKPLSHLARAVLFRYLQLLSLLAYVVTPNPTGTGRGLAVTGTATGQNSQNSRGHESRTYCDHGKDYPRRYGCGGLDIGIRTPLQRGAWDRGREGGATREYEGTHGTHPPRWRSSTVSVLTESQSVVFAPWHM